MLGLGQKPLLLGALLLFSIVSGQSIVYQRAADAYRPQSPATTADGEIRALDNDASRWDVPHCEVAGAPVSCADSGITFDRPANEAIVTPSGDNRALRATLRDGPAYSGVMWRRVLQDHPDTAWAEAFEESFDFYYRPPTTFNNEISPSRVQAVEFSFAIYRNDPSDGLYRIYDWELQWLNVRDIAGLSPIWRLWAGHASGAWLPIGEQEVPARLQAEQWHHVVLRGQVLDDAAIPNQRGVHYVAYSVDNVWYPIHRTFAPVIKGNIAGEDVAQVHVQLDGPADMSATGGYEVLVDNMAVRYFSAAPWQTNCPKLPDEAAQLFGGSPDYWSILPATPNGWKYNLNAVATAPPIRNGYIPARMQADWWDGSTAHMGVVGVARIPYATIATVWCPEVNQRSYLPLMMR